MRTAPPTFGGKLAVTPGGNEDDLQKFQKKIRVSIMGVVNDSQIPEVIRKKNVIMKHPIGEPLVITVPSHTFAS